jgi:response regulator RpfG family c-di-GMP phosphodiesterase
MEPMIISHLRNKGKRAMKNKKSILIVDDDIAHRTMLRILLEWEYEVAEADCGAVAIEKVQRTPFDLVLFEYLRQTIENAVRNSNINRSAAS